MGQPFHLPDRQDWAVEQERRRHTEALYAYGEYAVFALMWNAIDHADGLVERCLRCFQGRGVITEVYKQTPDTRCPECFGTTYEGGYKALLVRPSLWDTTEEDYRTSARGDTIAQTSSVQTSWDFRLRTGDYIFRADGSRWQMRTLSSNLLRTGFAHPSRESAVLGYNFGTVSREDESTVAYLMPPDEVTLKTRLDVLHAHWPLDFSDLEDIRGPLQ